MKRMWQVEIDREAKKIRDNWTCRYGRRNADKLSLAVRRLFRKSNGQHKKVGLGSSAQEFARDIG